MNFAVEKKDDGKTVLSLLKTELGLSGSMIRHLKFLKNGITVNGTHVTVRYRVSQGEVLTLKTEDGESDGKILPVPLPLSVIFEDGELIVADKPPMMPTHPSHNHYDDTLANALAYYFGKSPYVFRPVNRLDRNTSGLVLVAKNRQAAFRLSRAMKERRIQKTYLAVLDGILPKDEGTIETHLRRTAQSIIVREVCSAEEGGDYALTRYRVLARSDTHTLVCASPITGRTHQLRVHFAHLGCPITGDDLYGSPSPAIARHALHAASLSFPHPQTEKTVTLSAPLPADMLSLLEGQFQSKGFSYELCPSLFHTDREDNA